MMDDESWIKYLLGLIRDDGWTPVGPEPSGAGWIVGALRFEPRSSTGVGPTGGGRTRVRAVEDLYTHILGDLPHRRREGERFDHELDGIPDFDLEAFATVRDDFHREGYDLVWMHPMTYIWHVRCVPHGETPQAPNEVYVGITALEAARSAWAAFQTRSRGAGS
ncbi:MAG: hypothetical protein ACRDP6_40790 [Actinoallomurus sp.]